jgi:PAS domain S-box-containing protein
MTRSNFNIDFSILNSLQDMCFFLDKNGNILQMNITASLKLNPNAQAGELKDHPNIFEIIAPEHKENVITAFKRCISTHKSEKIDAGFDLGNDHLETVLNFLPSLHKSTGNEQNDYTCLLIARDVSAEKSKEIELLRFYKVAENTVNPLEITNKDGMLIYVNPAFVATSGYSKEELIGQNPRVFSSGKNSKKFWIKMWDTIQSGKVWVGEIENRKKNGEPFFTQLLISPIIDKQGNITGYFGIHRDLSEKRLLEKQLIHTQKMESIGTLAAGIAHEVGNPLASISALVQVAQRSTNDSFISEKLSLVKNQVTRISKIIRDLVDFSRPSNYELQLTDINKSISEAVEITKVGTKAKDIEFSTELTENIPHLPLISDQVQQVFVNILLNAVDAIMETNSHTKHKIDVKSELKDTNIVITFKDTGKGIPEEHYSKVFEPFFTTKKPGKGTGLGLWVSYGIIKSFQGDIKVTSVINSGTTFIITLPINPNI